MFALTDALKIKVFAVLSLVFLVVLLGVFGYYKVQVTALNHTVSEQRERIGALEVEVATLTEANQKMAAAVKEQNARVAALVADFKAASAQADKAIAKAQADAAKWKDKYSKVLNAPPTSKDECADLASRVNAYLAVRAEGGL